MIPRKGEPCDASQFVIRMEKNTKACQKSQKNALHKERQKKDRKRNSALAPVSVAVGTERGCPHMGPTLEIKCVPECAIIFMGYSMLQLHYFSATDPS